MPTAPPAAEHDPYAAMRIASFRRFLSGNIISILGWQMQTTAVLWEINERGLAVYDESQASFMLGLVGLVQIVPYLTLALVAGQVADRYDRRKVIAAAVSVMLLCSLSLAIISALAIGVWAIYVCLFFGGIARAFVQPAKSSLLPQIVPRDRFANAVTWNMGTFQLASVLGPALGGFLIAFYRTPAIVYLCDVAAMFWFLAMLSRIERPAQVVSQSAVTLQTLTAGIGFVRQNKVLLGAMALDMFAVLLGGATALEPVYAKSILHCGPAGLGWMQAAPALGALVMSVMLAHRPPIAHAGRTLLLAVVGFGLCMVAFGFSRSLPLSLAALCLSGAMDNISVVVRHTLVQLLTPDEMRGRVSAVNGMFIGISNELGSFESGLVARFTSPTVSVVSGGLGTLAVVGWIALAMPKLRRYGRLDGSDELEAGSGQPAAGSGEFGRSGVD
jgi:MFS family permease